MQRRAVQGILSAMNCEPGSREGGEHLKLLNPLAIGVSLGGQLLDIVAPRPKLRAGAPQEFSLLSQRAGTRTAPGAHDNRRFVGLSIASGKRSAGVLTASVGSAYRGLGRRFCTSARCPPPARSHNVAGASYPLFQLSVLEQVRADVVRAMKAGERDVAGALRLLVSELQKDVKEGDGDELAVAAARAQAPARGGHAVRRTPTDPILPTRSRQRP